jgi:hypothetical protein
MGVEGASVGRGLWLEWTAASAIGLAIGQAVASIVPQDSVPLGALYAAVMGLPFGFVQWLVLRRRLESSARWIPATALGSAVGGGVGLAASFAAGETVIQPWAIFLFGGALGVSQWLVLRARVTRASWWVLMVTLGFPLSFVVGLFVSFTLGFGWFDVDPIFGVVSLAFFGAVAGAVFGSTSGALLVWLLRAPRRLAAPAVAH